MACSRQGECFDNSRGQLNNGTNESTIGQRQQQPFTCKCREGYSGSRCELGNYSDIYEAVAHSFKTEWIELLFTVILYQFFEPI